MLKMLFVLLSFILPSVAYGYKPDKCFKSVTKNSLIKYDYPGNLSSEYMTKKYGSTEGPTQSSFQSSMQIIDPFVSSGRITSSVQFSSSFGSCSYFALRKELKREYIARNDQRVKEQVAFARGEHLNAVLHYSGCEAVDGVAYASVFQDHYSYLAGQKSADDLTEAIDLIILSNPVLRSNCDII